MKGYLSCSIALLIQCASFWIFEFSSAMNLPIARQTYPECETPCSPIMNFVGSGQESCTPQACCSSTFEQDYLDCFTCIGKAQNLTDFSQYQSGLDGLTSACLAVGITVPKLTFPGQNPDRALPSFTSGTLPTGAVSSSSTATSSARSASSTSMAPITITFLPSGTSTSTGAKVSTSASNDTKKSGDNMMMLLFGMFASSVIMIVERQM